MFCDLVRRIQRVSRCRVPATRVPRGGVIGGQGATAPPPKGFKKGKNLNMGYFHALKLAFLSSLIKKYMLWEGFYHDFSTKKVSASGGFAPWPPPRGSAPWTPARGAAPWTPEVTSPTLTIYPGAAPESPYIPRVRTWRVFKFLPMEPFCVLSGHIFIR